MADDSRILRRLLGQMERAEDIPDLTAGLGGRWVIVARDPSGTFLYHDAAGARQVHFAARDGVTWCGTRAETLAKILGSGIDPQAKAYARSADFVFMSGGRWWPGDGTLFRGVRRLLPNHRLDLGSGAVSRYWPDAGIGPIAVDRAVDTVAEMLRGLMRAASERFELVLLLTGGRDSRTALAASRDLRHRLGYVSINKRGPNDPDVLLPRALLGSLGLPHQVAIPRGKPTGRFWRLYRANSPRGNREYAANAEAIRPFLGPARAGVFGNVAEVLKIFYGKKLKGRSPDGAGPSDLARMTGHGEHPYALAAFAAWLEGAMDRGNVGLLDLFYWEQRLGSWLAGWLSEYDLVWREWVSPFNCRRLLVTALGVDEAFRRPPDYLFHGALIERLWPDLLAVRFCGATPRETGAGESFRRWARRHGVGWYRKIFG